MKLNNLEVLNAQGALARLMEIDLPIMVSLDLAIISNMVDGQARNFGKVRDNLFKKYFIKTSVGDVAGTIKFESDVKGKTDEETETLKRENLEAFSEKFNELLEAKTEDFNFKKAKLPSDIKVKPEILKSLVEFVEVA